jgi:hypothetical protein
MAAFSMIPRPVEAGFMVATLRSVNSRSIMVCDTLREVLFRPLQRA